MIIYVDVVFIENFIINLFLLHITAKTVKNEINLNRILFSSILGAGYVIILLYSKLKFLSFFSVKILMAFIMVVIAYNNKSFIAELKNLCIFISYAMFLAGMCLFLQLNSKDVYSIKGAILGDFSYKKQILALMIIYIFTDRIITYVKDKKILKKLIYNVEIVTNEYNKTIKAFLDTGNELREPISNLPVLIVEKSELLYAQNITDKLYISYKAVNGEYGQLEAFKPLYINIYMDDEKKEKKQVVVALCDGKLSKENNYSALLSRGIFE